jgi:hypothetical protein
VRLLRDTLIALLTGFVVVLVVASTGQHHLVTYLWIGVISTALALVIVLCIEAKQRPKSSAVARGVFAVETSGGFAMSRLSSEHLTPHDRWLLTVRGLRITNRQTDGALSVDIRLHLPPEITGTNQPLSCVRDVADIPPAFAPDHPLTCPFRVGPGDTESGDALFVLPASVYLDNWMRPSAPPGVPEGARLLAQASVGAGSANLGAIRPRVEVIDYVSDKCVEIEIGERVPAAPTRL